MADLEWGQVAVSFLSGGAFGALLKLGWDIYASRRQPVRCIVEAERVFHAERTAPVVQAVTVRRGDESYDLANLSIIRVRVVNRGNLDHDSLTFGVAVDGPFEAVFAECDSPDRHHKGEVLTEVGPNRVLKEVDFRVGPFNRADTYLAKVFVHSLDGSRLTPAQVKLSTPAPVRLVPTFPAANSTYLRIPLPRKYALLFWLAFFAITLANIAYNEYRARQAEKKAADLAAQVAKMAAEAFPSPKAPKPNP